MWLIPLFVPVLLLVSYVEHIAPSSAGSGLNSIAWAAASALIAGTFVFYLVERHRSAAFLRWLHEHRDALRTERLEYSGCSISRSTEVTQYRVCVSMILFTLEFRTAFSVPAQKGHRRDAVFATLMTLLLGWWGIPFGPIYTIAATIQNVRGGDKRLVQALLNELAADVEAQKT